MKKGLILINAYAQSASADRVIERYKEEFCKLGVTIDVVRNNNATYYIGGSGVATSLNTQYDFALFFDKDKHLSYLCEQSGIPMFNSAQSIEYCDDKMMTYIKLLCSDITMPITISSPLCYSTGDGTKFLNKVTEILTYPIVVKENYGSFGMQVYLAKTRAELENLYARLINKPHLYQQFIASSSGMDARMIVIGGKYFSAMKRVSKSDFRSNIELGGVGEEFCPTQSFIDTAERVAKKLGLDYCGIDILFGEHNEPIVCEVNSNAFFIEMERIARVNVAGRYASYIVGKVYK